MQGVVLKARVVGVFRTGITSLDAGVAYALLAKAQVVLERPNVVNQLRLRLAEPEAARDIAIMKSIGFRERDILSVFLLQGLLVGAAGTLLGWLLGFLLFAFMGSLRFEIEGFVLHRSPAHYALSGAFALAASLLAA